jgi:hypothetical protein
MTMTEPTLPGSPGPVLQTIFDKCDPVERTALRNHLVGFTSAEWLAECLRTEGHKVSASTIRTYRRSLSEVAL